MDVVLAPGGVKRSRQRDKETGGKHPLSSTAVFYLPRVVGGLGMKSVEHEYKVTKIKAAIKLYLIQTQ